MLGAIFGKCGEYMKLDRDKSTFKGNPQLDRVD